jgi:hypothetical protein
LSTTTITRTVTGSTPASVTLRSIVRTDTGAAVAVTPALPQAFTLASAGTYTFTITDPALGLTYRYVYRVTFSNDQFYEDVATIAGTANLGPTYLTVSDAASLAGTLPAAQTAAFLALSADAQAAALSAATADVDAAGPYQGQKYTETQTLEFPRLPYLESIDLVNTTKPAHWPAMRAGTGGRTRQIWDWDDATNTAVVPRNVKVAVLHQAESIAANVRQGRLEARHDGLASQSVGSLSESYRDVPITGLGSLCFRAANLLNRYRAKSGRLL